MEVTTQNAIHDRFVAVIQATVPTYPEHRQFPWVYCGNLSEVYGPEIRRFIIDEQIAEPVAEGLFSQGEEYAYLLEICVGYGGQTKAGHPGQHGSEDRAGGPAQPHLHRVAERAPGDLRHRGR